jgi:hypothetical protein
MRYAIAAHQRCSLSAVAGTVAAIMGSTGAAVLIWIAGGIASASIVSMAHPVLEQ